MDTLLRAAGDNPDTVVAIGAASLQDDTMREVATSVEELNGLVAKLTGAVDRLNRGSRWLVGLTIVLTACTVALLFVGYAQLTAARHVASGAPEVSRAPETMAPPPAPPPAPAPE